MAAAPSAWRAQSSVSCLQVFCRAPDVHLKAGAGASSFRFLSACSWSPPPSKLTYRVPRASSQMAREEEGRSATHSAEGDHGTRWVISAASPTKLSPELERRAGDAEKRPRTVALAWGSNTSGQLGHGDFLSRVTPAPIEALAQTTLLTVVCGSRLTLALDKESRVFAWGKGEDGALGIGITRVHECGATQG